MEFKALKTIAYFSLFTYPLRENEIVKFTHGKNETQVLDEIRFLLEKGVILRKDDFYFIDGEESGIAKRLKGNKMAMDIFGKAKKSANKISKFPYVRGVAFSGSLSKQYFDEESDVDFFIITKPNRLWIARTLLIVYKKVFLLNSRKYFCVNYFISSDSLVIPDKNRFTATEIATLIPYSSQKIFDAFFEINAWAFEFFQNYSEHKKKAILAERKTTIISGFIEWALGGKLGNHLDAFFKKITKSKWKRKFNKMEKKQFDIALRSTKSASKHHPQNFQNKVLTQLNTKLSKLSIDYKLEIEEEYA